MRSADRTCGFTTSSQSIHLTSSAPSMVSFAGSPHHTCCRRRRLAAGVTTRTQPRSRDGVCDRRSSAVLGAWCPVALAASSHVGSQSLLLPMSRRSFPLPEARVRSLARGGTEPIPFAGGNHERVHDYHSLYTSSSRAGTSSRPCRSSTAEEKDTPSSRHGDFRGLGTSRSGERPEE